MKLEIVTEVFVNPDYVEELLSWGNSHILLGEVGTIERTTETIIYRWHGKKTNLNLTI